MATLFEQFAVSRKAEVEGVDITFGGKNIDGTTTSFRISRMSKANKRYQKMIEAETKPHIHAIRNETLDPALDEEITKRVFIATILLGWNFVREPKVFGEEAHTLDGPADSTGNSIKYVPFSASNADLLFSALPELYNTLREQAQKMSLFRSEELVLDSKI